MVEWRFCRGLFDFRCAERGELRGKTWWSCGESVVEITSRSVQLKHANFLHIFRLFLWGMKEDLKNRLAMTEEIMSQRGWPFASELICLVKPGKKMAN
jgi:hypothetical protein